MAIPTNPTALPITTIIRAGVLSSDFDETATSNNNNNNNNSDLAFIQAWMGHASLCGGLTNCFVMPLDEIRLQRTKHREPHTNESLCALLRLVLSHFRFRQTGHMVYYGERIQTRCVSLDSFCSLYDRNDERLWGIHWRLLESKSQPGSPRSLRWMPVRSIAKTRTQAKYNVVQQSNNEIDTMDKKTK
mmetsp:Transcript_15259/g.23219  ORF Transcript_15259/g.23219 Transcript_15259/m.23219 type:complete len:188 (+) Transcript_15259:230-793(+)